MSGGDDHGNSSGHGHDSNNAPTDIIPLGSWQDNLLALVCLATLVGFYFWAQGFQTISRAHQGENGRQTHAAAGQAE